MRAPFLHKKYIPIMRQQQQSALASHLVIIQVTLLLCFSWFNPSHSFQNYAQLCHDRFTPSTPRLNKILVPARVDSYNDDESAISSWGRRLFLGSTLLFLPQPKVSVAETQVLPVVANLDALLDLPPVTNGCIRIFLCRHGQTENNRLRKVQGARVDPPINANGVQQAINLGKTLHRLDPTPDLFFASNLQRAQMTAQLAASQIDPKINIQCLTALSEVDFGPTAEGQPVALAKAGMQATYAAWATGRIDYRPQGGQGESGRDVSMISRPPVIRYLQRDKLKILFSLCVCVSSLCQGSRASTGGDNCIDQCCFTVPKRKLRRCDPFYISENTSCNGTRYPFI